MKNYVKVIHCINLVYHLNYKSISFKSNWVCSSTLSRIYWNKRTPLFEKKIYSLDLFTHRELEINKYNASHLYLTLLIPILITFKNTFGIPHFHLCNVCFIKNQALEEGIAPNSWEWWPHSPIHPPQNYRIPSISLDRIYCTGT